jgi:hypothetical protein
MPFAARGFHDQARAGPRKPPYSEPLRAEWPREGRRAARSLSFRESKWASVVRMSHYASLAISAGRPFQFLISEVRISGAMACQGTATGSDDDRLP